MFDLVSPVYEFHNVRNSVIIIAIAALVLAVIFAVQKKTGKRIFPESLFAVSIIAIMAIFIVTSISTLNEKDRARGVAYDANISQITDAGVEVLVGNEGTQAQPTGYYTFLIANRVNDATLKTNDGELLSCKIIISSDLETFDVQCLDPSKSTLVPLEDAISAS